VTDLLIASDLVNIRDHIGLAVPRFLFLLHVYAPDLVEKVALQTIRIGKKWALSSKRKGVDRPYSEAHTLSMPAKEPSGQMSPRTQ
jgi:hypothetical protein